ncbi:MAG: tyrosine-type recombinase/integrase [Solirubrobacteraceae bacterium]
MYAGNGGTVRKRRERVERGIYRQPNGRYTVCFMLDGKLTFRAVGYELDAARQERQALVEAARRGVLAAAPRLRFAQVAGWWLERFERRVAVGERCERTLDSRRYHVEHHLLPALGGRLLREIAVQDVYDLLGGLREQGRTENTVAGALATLQGVMRFAVRNGWIADSPVNKLENHERPHPSRLASRVLGREEIQRLLNACLPAYRPLIATALYTGMRHSELLGLVWRDVDPCGGVVHVRAQLSRARGGTLPRRVALKTELSDQALDAQQLEGALEQLDENLQQIDAELPDDAVLTADAGYFSEENVRITAEHGLDPYIATGRFKRSEPQPPAPRGPIPKDATPKQRMARKLKTKKGRAVYARRKAIVEPVFGQIGTVQDGRRVLIRGKPAARAQWRFECAIHNLLKLHRNGGLALLRTG